MSDIVLGKVGRGLATRVPYDAVVEYLESDRNQWIDTGVQASSNVDAEVEFSISALSPYYQYPFGYNRYDGSSFGYYLYGMESPTSAWCSRYNRMGSALSVAWETGVRYVSSNVANVFRLEKNGVAIGTQTPATKTFDYKKNCYLFATNNGSNAAGNKFGGRIYRCRICDNGVVARDLIPVRVGTVGYMYDRAHPFGGPLGNGLYPNAGDGAFVLGPDVVERNLIPYVTDGLTAMWDGKWNAGIMAHDPGARTWKDLVGVADLVKYGATAPSRGADYLLEDDYWKTTDATVLGALNAGPATLELVACVYGAPNVGCTLFGGDKLQLFGYIMHAGVMMDWRWSGGAGNLGIAPTDANIHYLSSQFIPSPRSRKTYKDGKLFLSDEAGGASLSTVMGVGVGFGSWASFARNAKIYCARVYNRALTPFEITHNYAVDRERFNLS